MNRELKLFLQNLIIQEKKYSFIFNRFAIDPTDFFETVSNIKNKDYTQTREYIYFFLNNDFTALLNHLICNADFLSKMNSESYSILLSIIYDSIYYFDHTCRNNKSNYDVSNRILKYDTTCIADEQIMNYNTSDAIDLYNKLVRLANSYYEEHETHGYPENEFSSLLKDEISFALYVKSLEVSSEYSLRLFVCKNSFLNMVDKVLKTDLIDADLIDNIYYLLKLSIDIRLGYKQNNIVDPKDVKSYNINKAKELFEQVKEMNNQNKKVLKFERL